MLYERYCQNCGVKFTKKDKRHMVGCDECTRWYHMKCVKANIKSFWKCGKCTSKLK